MTMITLPAFELLAKQPKIPHVARTVAQNDVKNEYGAEITFTVRQSRNGRDWWISASREGFCMSNTLHTSVASKAQAWIAAVQAGKVAVVEARTLKCDMTRECKAEVTHIDNKGFVYCTGHGEDRRDRIPCRKLRPHEIKQLTYGQPLSK